MNQDERYWPQSKVSTDFTIWETRWKSLDQAMNDANAYMKQDTEPTLAQISLKSLLHELHTFGRRQYEFFRKGFAPISGKLEISRDIPPDHALRLTLNQIMFDFALIQRAWQQRVAVKDDGYTKNKLLPARRTLELADNLAFRALTPLILRKEFENNYLTVVTYFQKEPSVRVIPYAPVALIGVPYIRMSPDGIGNTHDLLATAHEVGHYVFRHLVPLHDPAPNYITGSLFPIWLQNNLSKQPSWLEPWLEEIFADIYGAAVAGPIISHSFQQIQREKLPSDLLHDNGTHPIGALRPFIYTYALRVLSRRHSKELGNGNVLDVMNERWEKWLEDHVGYFEQLSFRPFGTNSSIKLQDAQSAIERLISDIINHTNTQLSWNYNDVEDWAYEPLWTPTNIPYADLNEKFNGFIKDSLDEPSSMESLEQILSATPPVSNNTILPNSSSQWLDRIFNLGEQLGRDSSDLRPIVRMPTSVWSFILEMNGWIIGGPEGDGSDPL